MAVLTIFIGLLALGLRAHAQSLAYNSDLNLLLEPSNSGGFTVGLKRGDDTTIYGVIGRAFSSAFVSEEVDGGVQLILGPVNLTVHTLYDDAVGGHGIRIKWQTNATLYRFDDCYDFLSDQWYGGPMQEEQIYPIQNAQMFNAPYVTIERDNRNVAERYWVSSAGQYIYVQPEAPLFVDYNNQLNNHICLSAQVAAPYDRDTLVFEYEVWWLSNVKVAHQHAVNRFIGKPSAVPDQRMVEHPVWSTWAQYWYEVNEEKVLQFAEEISTHNFTNSQIEIDDDWEVCYGSLTVNETKFPNFTQMVQTLNDRGYRVTLWIHPFINSDCEPWYSQAIENNYVVVNQEGSHNTTWWNSAPEESVHVDFTNPDAAEWWSSRVRSLQERYGIDSFKFDAGESSQLPQISVQHGDKNLHPLLITDAYVRTCANFGNMVEVRSAFKTQDLPIYLRMVDRDSIWGLNNGLATVLTATLEMNLAGYPFVLPDMIGGNGFNLNHEQANLPTKELFIRWVQATTFLPVMQFSFAPWNFDNETVEISRRYSELHNQYSDVIWAAMEAAVAHGTPVNAPLWWIAPLDNQTFTIWDEYLVGENIIVAPVLQPGAIFRDIYLPAGTWLEAGDPERVHEGPLWLQNFSAPIDTLPFFVREDNVTDAASVPSVAVLVMLCTALANIFM